MVSPDKCSVVEEAVQHWSRCRYMATQFSSQAEPLVTLKHFLLSDVTSPLVVYGAHGGGKSKIISKLAFEVGW